jgi:hypothetical protein
VGSAANTAAVEHKAIGAEHDAPDVDLTGREANRADPSAPRASPVTATWQDPTANHSIAAGNGLTGSHVFKTPGSNDGGDSDWVLVLTAP